MSSPKHTPGPWQIIGDDAYATGCDFIDIAGAEDERGGYRTVAWVMTDVDVGMTDEERANAALISAAPELLASALAYVDFIKCRRENHGDISTEMEEVEQQTLSAIAKATGDA